MEKNHCQKNGVQNQKQNLPEYVHTQIWPIL